MAGVQNDLAAMLEIHRDPGADHGLDLAEPPIRAARVADEGTGYEAGVQGCDPLAPIDAAC